MGTEFLKLRLGREYQRKYHLDHDLEYLHWRPSSKKPDKAVCMYYFAFFIYLKCVLVRIEVSLFVVNFYFMSCYFITIKKVFLALTTTIPIK